MVINEIHWDVEGFLNEIISENPIAQEYSLKIYSIQELEDLGVILKNPENQEKGVIGVLEPNEGFTEFGTNIGLQRIYAVFIVLPQNVEIGEKSEVRGKLRSLYSSIVLKLAVEKEKLKTDGITINKRVPYIETSNFPIKGVCGILFSVSLESDENSEDLPPIIMQPSQVFLTKANNYTDLVQVITDKEWRVEE